MLADDHHSVRQAYAGVLGMKKKFEVIGQAENGQALLDLVAPPANSWCYNFLRLIKLS